MVGFSPVNIQRISYTIDSRLSSEFQQRMLDARTWELIEQIWKIIQESGKYGLIGQLKIDRRKNFDSFFPQEQITLDLPFEIIDYVPYQFPTFTKSPVRHLSIKERLQAIITGKLEEHII